MHCFYFLGDFGQALLIRSYNKDVILTRNSHNCAGTAFVQGDSASGSKFIEQTLRCLTTEKKGKSDKIEPKGKGLLLFEDQLAESGVKRQKKMSFRAENSA